ncbi:MAG TPA: PLP-dependent aminotransferase family protein [Polyangia bacterium]|nr:PLP-dependent aminotransferase family protein [Polyangia bacterium]
MDPRIERLQRQAAADQETIGLAGGLPADEQFPRTPLARAFLRAISPPGVSGLQYGWPEGRERLRAWIAERLRLRGAHISADDVIITSGAQQAITLATQVLVRPGQALAVDAATYPAALALFRARGAAPVARPAANAACHYVMPAIGNPDGHPLSPAERNAVLATRRPIIEDDAYADLRFDGAAPPPLLAVARGRVWHVGTFSKTLCPGLRVGWLVPPRQRLARTLRLKHAQDLEANHLAQSILEAYLLNADFDARLGRLRTFYRRRAVRLAAALRRHLPAWRFTFPAGGFSIWVMTDEDGDDIEFLKTAILHRVSFDPGRQFRPDRVPHPLMLRLCFSATSGPRLEEGVRRLAAAWDDYRRQRDAAAGSRAASSTSTWPPP